MKNILITGGFGKIGKYFIQNHHRDYHFRAMDIKAENSVFPENVEIVKGDLADEQTCEKACEGMDTVVHLAGVPDPDATFEQVLHTNMINTKNILNAAIKQRCRRFILASSAQTIEGYAKDIQINKNMPVRPGNLYGVSKCFGEALTAYHAYRNDISVICLRIGAYEFPSDFTEMNARDLSAFLHPDDFNQLLTSCIAAENIQYEILNAISDNRYKRLDITEAKEKVGYKPKANAFELFKLKKE